MPEGTTVAERSAARSVTIDAMRFVTPRELTRRIEKAGYYPNLVADTLAVALADEETTAHLVHSEATFDTDTVRRHLSVLAITPTRLIFVHADDHGPGLFGGDGEEEAMLAGESFPGDALVAGGQSHAVTTSEAIPLSAVGPVMITHVVPDPEHYRPGSLGREMTLSISWGSVSRIDMEPATCGDPHCDADHGYTGAIAGDDLSLRISSEADGAQAVDDALTFARALSAATARGAHGR